MKVLVNLLPNLEVRKFERLERRFEIVPIAVHMTTIPNAPGLLFSLLNEGVQVLIRAIAEKFKNTEFSLCLFIRFHQESLCAIDDILCHSHLNPVWNDVIVEAPGIELNLAIYLLSHTLLQLLDFLGFLILLQDLVHSGFLASDSGEDLLLVCIDIKFKQIV